MFTQGSINKDRLHRGDFDLVLLIKGFISTYAICTSHRFDICRFELYLTRQKLSLSSYYKERTPADCKFLQNALKTEFQFDDLPPNMMPMGQLEAIVGALIMRERAKNPSNIKTIFNFNGIDVINIEEKIVTNL